MTFCLPLRIATTFGGALCLSACVSAPVAPPPVPPPPVAAPSPAPSLAPDWRDWPVAAGDWSYRATDTGSMARFGAQGGAVQLVLRCDLADHTLSLSRLMSAPDDQIAGQMTIRTTNGDARWPVLPGGAPGATTRYAVATRAAIDGAFDWILYSRGRFVIEAPGAPPLSVPAWAEVARVVEDCRG